MQALTPPDHCARGVFCQWLLAKCIVNTQFGAHILFTDEEGFTWDGIGKFHNTHVWVHDNPHTTVASRHQHRFSINVWVGILGDQLLGPVVLPKRLTGATCHHSFLWRFTSTLGTCASSSTTHVVHVWWGITSFSPPDFRWTVVRMQRPSQLVCTIPWP
jgi:hypothetical protein